MLPPCAALASWFSYELGVCYAIIHCSTTVLLSSIPDIYIPQMTSSPLLFPTLSIVITHPSYGSSSGWGLLVTMLTALHLSCIHACNFHDFQFETILLYRCRHCVHLLQLLCFYTTLPLVSSCLSPSLQGVWMYRARSPRLEPPSRAT